MRHGWKNFYLVPFFLLVWVLRNSNWKKSRFNQVETILTPLNILFNENNSRIVHRCGHIQIPNHAWNVPNSHDEKLTVEKLYNRKNGQSERRLSHFFKRVNSKGFFEKNTSFMQLKFHKIAFHNCYSKHSENWKYLQVQKSFHSNFNFLLG